MDEFIQGSSTVPRGEKTQPGPHVFDGAGFLDRGRDGGSGSQILGPSCISVVLLDIDIMIYYDHIIIIF